MHPNEVYLIFPLDEEKKILETLEGNASSVVTRVDDPGQTMKWEVENRTPLGSKVVHFGCKNIDPSKFKKYGYNTLTVRYLWDKENRLYLHFLFVL